MWRLKAMILGLSAILLVAGFSILGSAAKKDGEWGQFRSSMKREGHTILSSDALVVIALLAVASFAVGWVVTRVGTWVALRRFRRATDAPWYERARLAYPARFQFTISALVVPLWIIQCPLSIVQWRVAGRWLEHQERMRLGVLFGTAALLGALNAGRWLEARICRPVEWPSRMGFGLRSIFMLVTLGPLLVTLAFIPNRWGLGAIVALAVGAALVTFNLYGGWLLLLRRGGQAHLASDRLAAIVGRVAERTGIHPRAVFEMVSLHANAMALVVPKALVFTRPILDALDDDELVSATAHELGHLAEPKSVYLVRVASSYMLIVLLAGIPLTGSFGILAAGAPFVLCVLGIIVLRRVGRRMEERSDRWGREHETDPGGYARALEKLYEVNLVPVVGRGRGVPHPHLYDRLTAAGSPPAYLRPAPPPRDWLAAVLTILALLAFSSATNWFVSAPEGRGFSRPVRSNVIQ
jgi:Zn-dependent protease with chaperone function